MTLAILGYKGFKDCNLFETVLNTISLNFNEIVTNSDSVFYPLSKEYSYNKDIKITSVLPKRENDDEAELQMIKKVYQLCDYILIFHNGKNKENMLCINMGIASGKDCYIYRTDLLQLKKYKQLTLNFEF